MRFSCGHLVIVVVHNTEYKVPLSSIVQLLQMNIQSPAVINIYTKNFQKIQQHRCRAVRKANLVAVQQHRCRAVRKANLVNQNIETTTMPRPVLAPHTTAELQRIEHWHRLLSPDDRAEHALSYQLKPYLDKLTACAAANDQALQRLLCGGGPWDKNADGGRADDVDNVDDEHGPERADFLHAVACCWGHEHGPERAEWVKRIVFHVVEKKTVGKAVQEIHRQPAHLVLDGAWMGRLAADLAAHVPFQHKITVLEPEEKLRKAMRRLLFEYGENEFSIYPFCFLTKNNLRAEDQTRGVRIIPAGAVVSQGGATAQEAPARTSPSPSTDGRPAPVQVPPLTIAASTHEVLLSSPRLDSSGPLDSGVLLSSPRGAIVLVSSYTSPFPNFLQKLRFACDLLQQNDLWIHVCPIKPRTIYDRCGFGFESCFSGMGANIVVPDGEMGRSSDVGSSGHQHNHDHTNVAHRSSCCSGGSHQHEHPPQTTPAKTSSTQHELHLPQEVLERAVAARFEILETELVPSQFWANGKSLLKEQDLVWFFVARKK